MSSSIPLSAMSAGQTGVVHEYAEFDELSQRLMHMGLVEGTEIEFVRRAPSGDPIEIKVMGYALSLRSTEAERVMISVPPE